MGHAGWIHKWRSRRFTNPLSPISFSLNELRLYSRLRRAARGNRRWTGATPPFCLPDRHGGKRYFHTRRIAWGVAPVPSIPGGKARTDTRDEQDGTHECP